MIHYTQVYFESGFSEEALEYELVLYKDSLKTTTLHTIVNPIPAFWVEDLAWGNSYWWSIHPLTKDKQIMSKGPLHKFSICSKINAIHIKDTRLDIRKNDSSGHAGGMVLLDHARGIFKRSGEQVWSLPSANGLINERKLIRDLRLSPFHTITLLAGPVPIEMDFEGNVLWKAPYPLVIGTDTIIYHHDFKRYENGHYYVLGNKKVSRKVLGNYSPEELKDEANIFMTSGGLMKRTLHGLLLEFDEKGTLLWYWDSSNYLSEEDLNFKKGENGLPTFGTHMNAFSINKSYTKAYLGFRDLNRIVKLNIKTGKVEYSYGESYPSGEARAGNDLFRGQHDATITEDGNILLFNNNNTLGSGGGVSGILMFKDAPSKKTIQPEWQFALNFDTLSNGKSTSAGNVDLLPNGNILVCGGTLARIFEVSREKKIVWDAIPFSLSDTDTLATLFPQYRSHWTPKVYYYHFLTHFNGPQNERAMGKSIKVKIYNTGNVEDQYIISAFNENNKRISSKNTTRLQPGAWSEIVVKNPRSSSENSIASIQVQSVSNTPSIKTHYLKKN